MKQPQSLSFFAVPAFALLLAAGCKQTAPVTDASLATAVQTRLSGDAAIASEPIQSSVENGVVTLSGAVSSQAARSLAANDAAQVTGVRTVINNLSVQTEAAPTVTPTPVPLPQTIPSRAPQPSKADLGAERQATARERNARKTSGAIPGQSSGATLPAPDQTAANGAAAGVAPPAPIHTPPSPLPAPVVRNVTIPTGTNLPVRITQTLDSATTQQGQSFSGVLASDVTIGDATVLKQGTSVSGRVTAVQEAAHFKGNSLLSVELTGINRRGGSVAVTTDPFTKEGAGRGKNTAEKVGGGAAIGAILGGILGGGKGAGIGAAAGGGLGAGANTITRGQQVQIPAETLVRFRLANPVTVRVAGDGSGAVSTETNATDTPASDSPRRPLN